MSKELVISANRHETRVALLEDVRDPHRRRDLLHTGLDESDVVAITEAERVEAVRLLARDVAWRRVALRVDLGVVADKRLPVLVAGTLDRLADLLAVEWHLRSLMGPNAIDRRYLPLKGSLVSATAPFPYRSRVPSAIVHGPGEGEQHGAGTGSSVVIKATGLIPASPSFFRRRPPRPGSQALRRTVTNAFTTCSTCSKASSR